MADAKQPLGRDLTMAPRSDLAHIAQAAFMLGVEDGEARRPPANAEKVMASIVRPLGFSDWRIFHARKFRQVYGAGYDIARATLSTRDLLFKATRETRSAVAKPTGDTNG